MAQFMDFEEIAMPVAGPLQHPHPLLHLARRWQQKLDRGEFFGIEIDIGRTIRAMKSYLFHVQQEFSREIDYFHLRGQDNILRYLPVGKVVVRLHAKDSLFETLARIAAARITGCQLAISIPPDIQTPAIQFLNEKEGRRLVGDCPVIREKDIELIGRLPEIDRIRYAAPDRVSKQVYQAAAKTGFYIARSPVMMEGRIELLQYYRQQSICNNYHRYGNLGERALEFESR